MFRGANKITLDAKGRLAMPTRYRDLSVKARLFSAIATLWVVTLVIAGVSLLMLRNAETWLDTLHRETLSEVSQALELSRNAADLATAAPFLAL